MSRARLTVDQWRALLDQQRQGAQSVPAFCAEHGLKPSTFFAWRRRLRDQANPDGGAFIELTDFGALSSSLSLRAEGSRAARAQEMPVPASAIEVALPGGVTVRVAEQLTTIEQLQRMNDGLSHRLDLALRRIYGRSSEKIDPGQLLLFGQAMQRAAQKIEVLANAQDAAGPDKTSAKRRGHGRRPLPAHLPRHRLEHPMAPEELTCPCCDKPRVCIGEEVSEQLDYTPASLFVIQHVRPKFACPRCEEGGVATAEKPSEGQVIDKGLPGPGLVAHVVTSKYADHLPLYRLEGMLARHGVEIARSTMCGWMKAAADLLAPLVLLMAMQVRLAKVIHTDDTPVPVQDPGSGKTRTESSVPPCASGGSHLTPCGTRPPCTCCSQAWSCR